MTVHSVVMLVDIRSMLLSNWLILNLAHVSIHNHLSFFWHPIGLDLATDLLSSSDLLDLTHLLIYFIGPKYTLVHYLYHFLEDTLPELLTFAEEIPNAIEAATGL